VCVCVCLNQLQKEKHIILIPEYTSVIYNNGNNGSNT